MLRASPASQLNLLAQAYRCAKVSRRNEEGTNQIAEIIQGFLISQHLGVCVSVWTLA